MARSAALIVPSPLKSPSASVAPVLPQLAAKVLKSTELNVLSLLFVLKVVADAFAPCA